MCALLNSASKIVDINTVMNIVNEIINFSKYTEPHMNSGINNIIRLCYSIETQQAIACKKEIESVIIKELNIYNYEIFLNLNNYVSESIKTSFNQKIHNIMYKDEFGYIVAQVQINFENKTMTVNFFANLLPLQRYQSPDEVYAHIKKLAKRKHWQVEYGGLNTFNNNIEIRYTDDKGLVKSAIILSSDNIIDTVVEYEYVNDQKKKMVQTGMFGQRTTIYKIFNGVQGQICIESDTKGRITRIIKDFEN